MPNLNLLKSYNSLKLCLALSKLSVRFLSLIFTVTITYTVTGRPPVVINIDLVSLEEDNLIIHFDSETSLKYILVRTVETIKSTTTTTTQEYLSIFEQNTQV